MPPHCRYIKNKWVFKIKSNKVYPLCLVPCWYSQISSVNFSENYSPVVNNITFCILLLMVLHFGYLAKMVILETAFLYRDYEEKIYMKCPQGMSNIGKDECIILNKCIYDLVEGGRQYYEKALKNSGFIGGNVDPCFYVKKSEKGVVYIALYVDNNLMVEDVVAIDDAITALKRHGLVLEVMEGLQDYLSSKRKFYNNKKRAWSGQPHLIKNMEKKFGKILQDVQSYKSPVMPKCLILRNMINSEKMSAKDEQEY